MRRLYLRVYLAPLVGSKFAHSIAGDLNADEIIAGVDQWMLGNRIRMIVKIGRVRVFRNRSQSLVWRNSLAKRSA
ncbi:MAG: hypothetical protein IPG67_06105 [Acidobacteria bacterium]|nr:hypothetical protein [Acidobacteriota bacterium]